MRIVQDVQGLFWQLQVQGETWMLSQNERLIKAKKDSLGSREMPRPLKRETKRQAAQGGVDWWLNSEGRGY